MMETTTQYALPTAETLRKQVFVAYSYRLYPKDDYRALYKALEDKYDVTFIFADEKITNMHIMKKIETFIRGSDFSIFDISGWNPNVTLELGFAMAVGEQWYIAIDPSRTEIKEVPSDLRGLDRIEYGSYTELGKKWTPLIEHGDKWNSGLDGARIVLRRKEDHDPTIPPQPLSGLQGQSGLGRPEGQPDARTAC